MEIKKSISEMTDEEYLKVVIGKQPEKELTTPEKHYQWIKRNLVNYGNCFVNLKILAIISINKLKKDLGCDLYLTDSPASGVNELDGKIIWVNRN